MSRQKILFVAEAVTLAHLGRMLFLSGLLRDNFDVELACSDAYADVSRPPDVRIRPLNSLTPRAFSARLREGRALYTETELDAYIRDDIATIGASRPDVIVGDFRLSLSVSARLAGIPYVNVTNAYWSPYARTRFRMPSLSFARFIPASLGDAVFRMLRPLAFAAHAIPMNRVRRAHGMRPLPRDVRSVYCDGDWTAYADLPQLIPVFGAPPTHRHIGPVPWSPSVALPAWWPEMMAGDAPIYVSLGSSGAAHMLPFVVDALRTLGPPVVLSTAGRAPDLQSRDHVWVTDFLPGDRICAIARAVVCNGGSPTAFQALANGVPVVGIASNLDQFINMDYIERFGAGRLLRADRVQALDVANAARATIENSDLREKARIVAAWTRITCPEREFPALLDELKTGTGTAAIDPDGLE
jgi:UDP:flavonoid glycosyltransferase YjiC (YdhE family)